MCNRFGCFPVILPQINHFKSAKQNKDCDTPSSIVPIYVSRQSNSIIPWAHPHIIFKHFIITYWDLSESLIMLTLCFMIVIFCPYS
jgi:hypothetical protein